jgi:VWFA-related protein
MKLLRTGPCTAVLLALISVEAIFGQTQPTYSAEPSADVPTFHVTSSLVFLDVTVLNKKGELVMKGLTKDDFIITEDTRRQQIFSFEPPESHSVNTGDENPDGKAAATIFVLDLLNSNFEDFAFIRSSVQKYLDAQPEQLNSPAELMVVGSDSLELLQGYTRSKEDLVYALKHLPAVPPYKMMMGGFIGERFVQSIDALQQIALQNRGVPGRKNIVWIGTGGPSLDSQGLTGRAANHLQQAVHVITNLLVDARMTVFVIYPGLGVHQETQFRQMNVEANGQDPFAGDASVRGFVKETGGKIFFNRNDIGEEIERSEELGSEYYTLTYQPHDGDLDGMFRHVRVTLRDPNLVAITKAGYFAPQRNTAVDHGRQTMINLAEAARSTIPFTAVDVKVSGLVQHPDSRTIEFTVQLKSKDLGWQPRDNGNLAASLILEAESLSGSKHVLASKLEKVNLAVNTDDSSRLPLEMKLAPRTLRVPRKTQIVRLIVETEDGAKIGTAEVDRRTIEAAPALPTPEPVAPPVTLPQSPEPSASTPKK